CVFCCFFSSRRRHTRSKRDWSSDVCSSDLTNIAHGYTDAILAGGAEATIEPLYFAGFSKMKAMSTNNDNPEKASRPFDVNRDGFVMAEGAGVLFLEAEEHAKARGAT